MDLWPMIGAIAPTEWLTVGLLLFAGTQVALQARQEHQRRVERKADTDELADRAFHYAWAEHFRLEGLAERLRRDDLIEMALLGVLKPGDVLPYDWGELTHSLASLGREAGFLGGVAASLCHDVERSIGIFTGSVVAFAKQSPGGYTDAQKVKWLRETFAPDLEPWEESIRKQVQELSWLVWDGVKQSGPARTDRTLDFTDEMSSEFARVAVASLKKRERLAGATLEGDGA